MPSDKTLYSVNAHVSGSCVRYPVLIKWKEVARMELYM